MGKISGIQHQPTAAELREHGKHEPAWVQEASAYQRSRDIGDLPNSRRHGFDMDRYITTGEISDESQRSTAHARIATIGDAERELRVGVAQLHESAKEVPAWALESIERMDSRTKPEAVRELGDDDHEMGM